jgi:DNA-binding CsgD family transcriptional regulator
VPTYGRPGITVGRDSEVAFLRQALEQSLNRRGSAIVIEGEPGMGKSHLLRGLVNDARSQDFSVVHLTGHVTDVFEPFVTLSHLPRLNDPLSDVVVPSDADPRTRFAAFNDYLGQLSRRPALLVIDDIQWVDESSLLVISRSIENAIDLGITFVCAIRTGASEADPARSETLRSILRACTRLHLEGLSELDSASLASTIGDFAVEQSDLRQIHRMADGNPLFTLEYLRLLRLSDSSSLHHAPPEVTRVIENRMRLANIDLRVLVALALLGGVATVDELVVIAEGFGLTPKTTRDNIAVAESAVLIGRMSGRTVEFVHPLYANCAANFPESHDPHLRTSVIALLERGGRFTEAFELCDAHLIEHSPDLAHRLAQLTVDEASSDADTNLIGRAAEFLLPRVDPESTEWVRAALARARNLIATGRRDEGWRLAEQAANTAQRLGLHTDQANALLAMARIAEFMPDTQGYTSNLSLLDLDQLPTILRARVLATSAQVVLSTPTDVTDAFRPLGTTFREAGFELTDVGSRSAWAWSTNAPLARDLANRALELLSETVVPPATSVEVLNSWREVHRSPVFLIQRLRLSERAIGFSDPSATIESRLVRSIDLYESGSRHLATSELIVAHEAAKRFGDVRGLWRITLRWAADALAKGDVDSAWNLSAKALTFGEQVGEPGRVPTLAAQQCAAAIERIFPADQLWVFSIDPALTAHGPSRALAALACVSAGDLERASDFLEDSFAVFDDTDRESSWLLTLTTLAEVASMVGHSGFAARAITALEPFADLNVTDGLGTLMRGPVTRYLGLAHRTVGDIDRAVDDLLRARLSAEHNGEELWRLAALVDIAETLAPSGSSRLPQLVRMADVDDAHQRQLDWRAERGRRALETAGRVLKDNLTLSDRQVTILREMARGLTIAEIGRALKYSHSTVRQESMAIYRLLGVDGRDAAITAARERFLI